jgi:hypothetical protein
LPLKIAQQCNQQASGEKNKMRQALAAAASLVVIGSQPVGAISLLPLAKPEIEAISEIMMIENGEGAMDMTVDMSITEGRGALSAILIELEPAAPNQDWDEATQSGVAFPIVDGLSLGVDYEIEETEDLAAHGISPGTASEEHESHNVMIRANIQFDLTK